MSIPEAWWRLDALGQAELVRAGGATPLELVEAAIERIEALNPAINAVITPLYEEGRRIASELADAGQPFRGVPVLLKDAGEELEGTPYYLGTSVLREIGYRSTRTTEFVRRLLDVGFVPIGKTNVPELSSGLTTEPRAFGPTRNPWDLRRTSGGSSGGSAAAIAAGLVAIATGSDATGSLRVPAALCGVATLRPTRGRVPTASPAKHPSDVWSGFVLSRSARDLDALFGLVADEPAEPAVGSAPLRIALSDRDPDGRAEVDAACMAAVAVVGEALSDLGHSVGGPGPAALPGFMQRVMAALLPTIGVAREVQLRWLEQVIERPLRPGDLGRDYARVDVMPPDAEQAASASAIADEARALLAWWDDYDLLVSPTTRQTAWSLGLEDGPQHAGPLVFPFSFTGQPVLSLPVAQSDEGLPVGVQLIGRPGADEQLLALARRIETVLPWVDRWPAMALDPS